MSRKVWLLILFAACALPSLNFGAQAKKDDLPRLPGAALLVGYPPGSLIVTTPSNTWTLAEGPFAWLNIFPSISRDGLTVASAARLKGDYPAPTAIATYSVLEQKWTEYQTEYKDVEHFQGGVAIAPDGSRLAFAVKEPPWDKPSVQIHVMDLKTREEKIIPASGRHGRIRLSWSPDGGRIVYDTMPKLPFEGATEYRPEIQILDLETRKSTKVANGQCPAWSPSGEWIAYLEHTPDALRLGHWSSTPPAPNRLLLIHPDGASSRILVTLRGGRGFVNSPIWSPDSKTILLNEWRNLDEGTMDIHLLDLATLKMTRKFRGASPVFAWAVAE